MKVRDKILLEKLIIYIYGWVIHHKNCFLGEKRRLVKNPFFKINKK